MLVSRKSIVPIDLPEEQIEVAEIGGSVLVRGMDMPRLARFDAARRKHGEPQADESEDDALARAGLEVLPLLLHLCVFAEDDAPVYSVAEWAVFLRRHQSVGLRLADAALRLTGLDAPKNA